MIGQTLSHYRIAEKVGQGGMGIVYKALDLHLDRYVALKLLPADRVSDPDRRRRFIQEAKSASALNHPNIVTIYDIDEVDGVYFIAMEYIAGRTLLELISSRVLRLEQSLDYAIQVADAISKAHTAGIVHRDIKPSNVMVNDENRVKVLDFGLAKLTGWPGDETRTPSLGEATAKGIVLGTLAYMSPEQARGREVDHRTDIFSLGVVLYQMITGEPLFSGPHAAAILDKLLYRSTPSLKTTVSCLPEALDHAIARATAKDPEDRYQSMRDMATDLRSISIAGELPAPPPQRVSWLRAILATASVLLALLLAIAFRGWLPHWLGGTGLPGEIRLVMVPFNNIGDDAEIREISDGLMEVLVTELNQLEQFRSSLSIVPMSEVRSENVTSASDARLAFGANLVLTGSIQKLNGHLILTINLVDARRRRQIDGKICRRSMSELIGLGDDAFENAVAMLELKLDPHERQALNAGQTRNQAAYNSYLKGVGLLARFDMSENVDRAIQLFRQAVQEDPEYALAHAALGEAYWRKFQRTRERKWVDAAMSSCLQAAAFEDRVASVHLTLGMVYGGTGQHEKAVDELTRAIDMDPRSSSAYSELGRAYEASGRLTEAESTYRKAIEMQPDSWSSFWALGVFYYNRSRYSEAAAQFQNVIKLAPDHFRAYSSLGGIYIFEGNFARAGEMFARSLSIRESPQAYSNLAASFILQGRSSEAVPFLEKATGMEGASYEIWGNLGDAYLQTRRLSDKAPAAYMRASEMSRADLSVNPENTQARARLAYFLVRLGNPKEALEEVARVGELAPEDPDRLFWAALVYELADERELALKALAEAAQRGYSQAIIRVVAELARLREDPRYRNVVEGRGVR